MSANDGHDGSRADVPPNVPAAVTIGAQARHRDKLDRRIPISRVRMKSLTLATTV